MLYRIIKNRLNYLILIKPLQMKRRKFVLLSTMGVAVAGASYYYFNYYNQTNFSSIVEPDALSYIWDRETIINTGAIYRKQIPDEDSKTTLTELLSINDADNVNTIKAIKEKIKTDFETENTVMINGWILSVTEARQCALFSLFQPI